MGSHELVWRCEPVDSSDSFSKRARRMGRRYVFGSIAAIGSKMNRSRVRSIGAARPA